MGLKTVAVRVNVDTETLALSDQEVTVSVQVSVEVVVEIIGGRVDTSVRALVTLEKTTTTATTGVPRCRLCQ